MQGFVQVLRQMFQEDGEGYVLWQLCLSLLTVLALVLCLRGSDPLWLVVALVEGIRITVGLRATPICEDQILSGIQYRVPAIALLLLLPVDVCLVTGNTELVTQEGFQLLFGQF